MRLPYVSHLSILYNVLRKTSIKKRGWRVHQPIASLAHPNDCSPCHPMHGPIASMTATAIAGLPTHPAASTPPSFSSRRTISILLPTVANRAIAPLYYFPALIVLPPPFGSACTILPHLRHISTFSFDVDVRIYSCLHVACSSLVHSLISHRPFR